MSDTPPESQTRPSISWTRPITDAFFAIALVIAVPVIFTAGRRQWFFLDEWDFLAARDLRVGSLLRPHNEHMVALPIILYRLLFKLVGLNHYWPYQALAVTAHLVTAILLRAVMLRAGCNRFIAMAATIVFIYFGTGRDNIINGFQVAFVGAVAFGLGAILLADHDGDLDVRDLAAAGCALGSLLCSGIGVPLVVALVVSTLLRRGWKIALTFLLPLSSLFLLWYARYGRGSAKAPGASGGQTVGYAWRIAQATLAGFGQLTGVGALIAVLTLIGLGLILFARRPLLETNHYAPTVGLLVGALVFLAITGYGRAVLPFFIPNRYFHIFAALTIPAIAVGFSSIAVRWRASMPALVALLLIGLPGNIQALWPRPADAFTFGNSPVVTAFAGAASRSRLPDSYYPLRGMVAPGVTMGWLRRERSRGRIPDSPKSGPFRANAKLSLSFRQLDRPPGQVCSVSTHPEPLELSAGQIIKIDAGGVNIIDPATAPQASAYFVSAGGPIYLEAVTDDLIVLANPQPSGTVSRCEHN